MTLEQKAREAAEAFLDKWKAKRVEENRGFKSETVEILREGLAAGYILAYKEAEQEIAALQVELIDLRAEMAESKANYNKALHAIESAATIGGGYIEEIAALKARVVELEGMVPRWARNMERYQLEKLGWLVAGGEMVWHRSPGDVEASWHCLMVPPIQLPEGE